MNVEDLVLKAKDALRTPYDALHDERHHNAVWKNCLQIIKDEKLENVDMEALQVAAWWHDVERGKEDDTKLLRSLVEDEKFGNKVVEIIESHSYDSLQQSIEAKVLFDADKLEYVSIDRIMILAKGHAKGEIDKEKFNYYTKNWGKRIRKVREQIHFPSVRQEFDDKLTDILKLIENDEILKVFTEDVEL